MVSCLVFSSTLFAASSFLGLIGAFAIIKYPLSRSFHLTESFLGSPTIM